MLKPLETLDCLKNWLISRLENARVGVAPRSADLKEVGRYFRFETQLAMLEFRLSIIRAWKVNIFPSKKKV